MNEEQIATNIKFVAEVEKHPLLYNFNLPEYSRRDLQEQAWKEVGSVVNLSVPQCREKWKNLRTVFARHMKPTLKTGWSRRRPYYLTESMKFAIPFIKTRERSGHLPESSDFDQTFNAPNGWTDDEDEDDEDIPKRTPVTKPKEEETEPTVKKHKATETTQIRGTRVDMRVYRHSTRKMFLLSLMPELDEMTPQQMNMFKRNMLQLIDDIRSQPDPPGTAKIEFEYTETNSRTPSPSEF